MQGFGLLRCPHRNKAGFANRVYGAIWIRAVGEWMRRVRHRRASFLGKIEGAYLKNRERNHLFRTTVRIWEETGPTRLAVDVTGQTLNDACADAGALAM